MITDKHSISFYLFKHKIDIAINNWDKFLYYRGKYVSTVCFGFFTIMY